QPKVPRDLETVCLKALAKAPERRYATAQALADDLRRWQNGEPIQARPVGQAERLGRWCRRNPKAAGLTAAGARLLVGMTTVSTVAAFRIAEARDRADWNAGDARRQFERAETSYRLAREALEKCLAALRTDPRFQEGEFEDMHRTLAQVELEFYQSFVQQRGEEPAFKAERARAFSKLGEITAILASQEDSIPIYEQGRDLWAELVRDHPDDPRFQQGLAKNLDGLGRVYRDTGRLPEAEQ